MQAFGEGRIWRDRRHAGVLLGERLASRVQHHQDTTVVGIPPGGIEVAAALAAVLQLPLSCWSMQRLWLPGVARQAIGALAPGNIQLPDDDGLRRLGLDGHQAAGLSAGPPPLVGAIEGNRQQISQGQRQGGGMKGARRASAGVALPVEQQRRAPIAAEPSPGEQAAAFIAAQLPGDVGAVLDERRIVLLGSLPRPPVAAMCALPGGFAWDERVRLCARLLRSGVQLVVLDSPRSRLLIETLLPLSADGHGRWQGGCLLEPDLSAACRDAAALLVLPGWRQPPSLLWRALAARMRPQALLFDLRPDPAQPPPDASGLRVWRMGVCVAWG